MLARFNNTRLRGMWHRRSLVVLVAMALVAVPAIYLSTADGVLADDAKRPARRDPSPEFLPKPTVGEERILVALEEPTEMAFVETPLQDVAAYLKQRHKIDIQFDRRALEDAAIGSDTPVTGTANNVKLRSGLELLLRDMDLTYLIKNEVLLITTPDRAESELLTRAYPVGDLVEQNNGATLITAITSTVRPQTWDKVGGPGSIVYMPSVKGLVISQTRDTHEEVLELLRALRGVREATVSGGAGSKE